MNSKKLIAVTFLAIASLAIGLVALTSARADEYYDTEESPSNPVETSTYETSDQVPETSHADTNAPAYDDSTRSVDRSGRTRFDRDDRDDAHHRHHHDGDSREPRHRERHERDSDRHHDRHHED